MARSLHLYWRIIGKERVPTAHYATHGVSQWLQQRRGTANPIRHGRAIKINAFAGVNLRLPIQWKMISVFAHQHMRQQAGAGPAVLDGA